MLFRSSVSNYESGDSSGAVSAWIYAISTDYPYIFSSLDEGTDWAYGIGFAIHASTNRPYIYQTNNDGLDVVWSTDGIILSQWNHIVYVSTGSAYKIYINGIEKIMGVLQGTNSGDWFSDTNNRDNISVGGAVTSAGLSHVFNGSISDVRIYNRALSAVEVKQLYMRGRP